MQSMVATRHMWERHGMMKIFDHLATEGCNEDAAFLLSHLLSVGDQNSRFYKGEASHITMYPAYMTWDNVGAWLKGDVYKNLNSIYGKTGTYQDFTQKWGDYDTTPAKSQMYTWARKRFYELKPGAKKSVITKVLNPFTAAKVAKVDEGKDYIPTQEAFRRMVILCGELVEKCNE